MRALGVGVVVCVVFLCAEAADADACGGYSWRSLKSESDGLMRTLNRISDQIRGKNTGQDALARAYANEYAKLRDMPRRFRRFSDRWESIARGCTGRNRRVAYDNADLNSTRARDATKIIAEAKRLAPLVYRTQLSKGNISVATGLKSAGLPIPRKVDGATLASILMRKRQYASLKWVFENDPLAARDDWKLLRRLVTVSKAFGTVEAMLRAGVDVNRQAPGYSRPIDAVLESMSGSLPCTSGCATREREYTRMLGLLRRYGARADAAVEANYAAEKLLSTHAKRLLGSCAGYQTDKKPAKSPFLTLKGTLLPNGKLANVTVTSRKHVKLFERCLKRVAEQLPATAYRPPVAASFAASGYYQTDAAAMRQYGESAAVVAKNKEQYALANPGAKDAIDVYRGPSDKATRRHYEGCKAGDKRACSAFARSFDNTYTVPAFGYELREKLAGMCPASGDACALLARAYGMKERPYASEKRSVELAEKACEAKSGQGCVMVGFRYMTGTGVTKNESVGRIMLEKACGLGAGDGCGYLAILRKGDQAAAASLAKKGCRLGAPIGCYAQVALDCAKSVDRRCHKALGSMVRVTKSRCLPNGVDECLEYGNWFLALRKPLRTDNVLDLATELIGQQCTARRLPNVCYNVSKRFFNTKKDLFDPKRGDAMMRRACNLDHAVACNELAWKRCHERGLCGAAELASVQKALRLRNIRSYIDTRANLLCRTGKSGPAKADYRRACRMGLRAACETTCVGRQPTQKGKPIGFVAGPATPGVESSDEAPPPATIRPVAAKGPAVQVAPLAGGGALSNEPRLSGVLTQRVKRERRHLLRCGGTGSATLAVSGILSDRGKSQVLSTEPAEAAACVQRIVRRWRVPPARSGTRSVPATFRVTVRR